MKFIKNDGDYVRIDRCDRIMVLISDYMEIDVLVAIDSIGSPIIDYPYINHKMDTDMYLEFKSARMYICDRIDEFICSRNNGVLNLKSISNEVGVRINLNVINN